MRTTDEESLTRCVDGRNAESETTRRPTGILPPGASERKTRRSFCINCGARFVGYALRYWFGANEVGPFCERCDKAIKTHTLFRDRG